MEFESNSAASRNGSQTGRISPVHGSFICALDPVGTCLCWKALFVPVLLPHLYSQCTHPGRDLPHGDELPGSQCQSPHSNEYQGSGPAIWDKGQHKEKKDSEARGLNHSEHTLEVAAEKVKFTQSLLLSSLVLQTMLMWPQK